MTALAGGVARGPGCCWQFDPASDLALEWKDNVRVLLDIVHPADVLFFKRPIENLRARGDQLLILSRYKDVACALLDEFGFPHQPITRASSGIIGLATELLIRDWAVTRAARRFRPDAMIGFGGVAISHVGRLFSVPSISFYDSENAHLQAHITWPFISRLYVPDSYSGPTPAKRTIRLPGTKELSYLHPSAFRPDREIAMTHGLDPKQDNFLVRVVAWRANHDVGKKGWTPKILRGVIAQLSSLGKVHLSSELPLPDELEPLRYRGPSAKIHHLLGHCRLLVGESATMASEAAILGVPSIYAGRDFPCYVRVLEAAGLAMNVAERTPEAISGAIDEALARPLAEIADARDAYVAACPDWAEVVVQALDDCVYQAGRNPRLTSEARP